MIREPIKYLLFYLLIFFLACSEAPKKNESRVDRLPFFQEETFTPAWIDQDPPKGFHQVAPFSLTNQEGEIVTQKDYLGKIYVTDFFFTTCPGICPRMMTNMAGIQDAFLNDEEVLLLSHSVTPERDSVAVLKEYATNRGIVSGKWNLVTGERQEIYDLGRKSYFVEEDLGLKKDPDDFLHTENFVLVDRNAYLRGIYNGLKKTDIQQLIKDINTLKEEN